VDSPDGERAEPRQGLKQQRYRNAKIVAENGVDFVQMESAMTLEPNEVRVIHALFHAILFRPGLSTHILGIIQAVV
jgi:hypothetical protein